MDIKDTIYIGQIAKLHGYKGGVSLYMDVSNPEDYLDIQSLYINLEGILTPFFIDSFKLKNKGFVAVKFQGLNTEEEAKKLLKQNVYLQKDQFKEVDDSSNFNREIIGFDVLDAKKGGIGKVTDLIDNESNPLILITYKGKEILLPHNEDLILNVDRKMKLLKVDAPEGLIDLYLE